MGVALRFLPWVLEACREKCLLEPLRDIRLRLMVLSPSFFYIILKSLVIMPVKSAHA